MIAKQNSTLNQFSQRLVDAGLITKEEIEEKKEKLLKVDRQNQSCIKALQPARQRRYGPNNKNGGSVGNGRAADHLFGRWRD